MNKRYQDQHQQYSYVHPLLKSGQITKNTMNSSRSGIQYMYDTKSKLFYPSNEYTSKIINTQQNDQTDSQCSQTEQFNVDYENQNRNYQSNKKLNPSVKYQKVKDVMYNKQSFKAAETQLLSKIDLQIHFIQRQIRRLTRNYLTTAKQRFQQGNFSQNQRILIQKFQNDQNDHTNGEQACFTALIQVNIDQFFEKFYENLTNIAKQLLQTNKIQNQSNIYDNKMKYNLAESIDRAKVHQNQNNFLTRTWKKTSKFTKDQVFLQKFKHGVQQRIKNSSIITSRQDYLKLVNFFQLKQIKSLDVIYKASENNFSVKRYYQTCGYKKDIIIICLNQYNKIIGGFSPEHFHPGKQGDKLIADQTGSSFVFSLTTNDKFILRNQQMAICRCALQDRIKFGTNYFCIAENSHINSNTWLFFDDISYDSLNYKNDRQSYIKIIGNQRFLFMVKQWEVIKVQFYNNY